MEMEIRPYDQVDPLEVLNLNMTVLGFPLTPGLVAGYRRHSRQVTPEFAHYALVDGRVAGQVGLFRCTVRTTEGPMPVGAVWAVCTLPEFGRMGVARALMDHAEERALQLGCRAITLATNRTRVAHRLYRERGYIDLFTTQLAFCMTPAVETAVDRALALRPSQPDDLPALEEAFRQNTADRLGFVLRPPDFLRAATQTELDPESICGIYRGGKAIGYILARQAGEFLHLQNALLPTDLPLSHLLPLLRKRYPTPYVQVSSLIDPVQIRDLAGAGYVIQPGWGTVMLKPLESGLAVHELLGIDSGRFYMDTLDFS